MAVVYSEDTERRIRRPKQSCFGRLKAETGPKQCGLHTATMLHQSECPRSRMPARVHDGFRAARLLRRRPTLLIIVQARLPYCGANWIERCAGTIIISRPLDGSATIAPAGHLICYVDLIGGAISRYRSIVRLAGRPSLQRSGCGVSADTAIRRYCDTLILQYADTPVLYHRDTVTAGLQIVHQSPARDVQHYPPHTNTPAS